jgi:hypothetical protein
MGYVCPWWRNTGGGGFSYDGEQRTLNYLAKAYGKMIYASAGDLHSIWGPNVIDASNREIEIDIEVPDDSYDDKAAANGISAGNVDTGPGSTQKTKRVKARGVYSRSGESTGAKYFPKPHLVSISTSGMDNLGINEKASYSYKTYNGYQGVPPPAIGDNAGMSWGWAYGGKVLRGCSKSGKVVGWTVTANMEGGYDITVDCICTNASVNSLAMAADQACAEITDPNVMDENGKTIAVSSLLSALVACNTQAFEQPAAADFTFNNGLNGCIVQFPLDYVSPPGQGQEDATKFVSKAYINFGSLVNQLINPTLKKYTKGTTILFDASSQTPIPIPTGLVSANPFELLTPGTSTYGPLTCVAGGGGFTGFPETLYIGADYIYNLIKNTNAIVINKQAYGGKTKFLSFKGFFDSLFSMFNQNLGRMYNLTCANSATKNDLNIYIVDFNNINTGISANGLGIVRSATCNAKLDGDEASVFNAIKNAPNDNASLVSGGPKAVDPPPNYEKHKADMGAKFDEGTVSALRGDNNTLVATKIPEATRYGVPANWNLSVTTDGSNYTYGGVITHACVPGTPINGYKVGFAITSVNHSVSAGDWTTSLSTYCRIYKG